MGGKNPQNGVAGGKARERERGPRKSCQKKDRGWGGNKTVVGLKGKRAEDHVKILEGKGGPVGARKRELKKEQPDHAHGSKNGKEGT